MNPLIRRRADGNYDLKVIILPEVVAALEAAMKRDGTSLPDTVCAAVLVYDAVMKAATEQGVDVWEAAR